MLSSCTKYIKSLNVSAFRSFKAKLDDFKDNYLNQNINNRTNAGKISNLNRQDAINWVTLAQRELSSSTIEEAFRFCNLYGEPDEKIFVIALNSRAS